MKDLRSAAGSMLAPLAFIVGTVTAAPACKTIAPATVDVDSGSGGRSGGGVAGNDGGVDRAVLPDMAMDKFSTGDATSDGACAAAKSSAKLVPLDLYVMMDSSKSMNDTDSMGKAKWSDLKQAMTSFFNDTNSKDFSVALAYFPDEQVGVPEVCSSDNDCSGGTGPCDQRKACVAKAQFSTAPSTLCSADADCVAAGDGDSCVPVQQCAMGPNCEKRNCVAGPASATGCPADCTPYTGYCRGRDICDSNDYATPKVAFGSLSDPAVVTALTTSLDNHSPGGYTPTGPALTGALKAAQAHAMQNLDRKTVVVLVTDGLPGAFIPGMAPAACTPPDVTGVASLLSGAMGTAGTPAIQTFVIGIFGPCDLNDKSVNSATPQANLDSWAAAGGTTKSVIVDTSQNVTQNILDALKQVQSTVINCQYAIPKDVAGGIDFMKVNVDFSSNAMPTPASVHYVGTKDKCDAQSGGWYYDVAPGMGTPTQIIACDKSCSDFMGAEGAQVDVALGCATIY